MAAFRRRAVLVGVVLLLLLAAGTVIVLVAVRPPSWYRPPSAGDEAAAVLGERVEYRLAEELQRVRPPAETWSLRLTEDQANAWLATRLPAWYRGVTGRPWPDELGVPQVRVDSAGLSIVMGVDLHGVEAGLATAVRRMPVGGGAVSVLGAGEDPAAPLPDGPTSERPAGHASIGLARIGLSADPLRLGRLPGAPAPALGGVAGGLELLGLASEDVQLAVRDPAAWLDTAIERFVRESADESADDAAGAGATRPGLPVRLADGRRVRLTAVGIEPGAVTLTFAAGVAARADR